MARTPNVGSIHADLTPGSNDGSLVDVTVALALTDIAVAHAYGWSDYTADMADEEILKRLLALNLEREA